MKILITGAGSTLGQSIFKALSFSRLKLDLEIVLANSELGPFFQLHPGYNGLKAKKIIQIPKAVDPNFKEVITNLCIGEKIDIVFSGTEHEVTKLAEISETFPSLVITPPPSIVRITMDKKETSKFLKESKIISPRTLSYRTAKALLNKKNPLIVKPRFGSASRGIILVKSEMELDASIVINGGLPNCIIQEYIGTPEEEYTVGCYLDKYSKKTNCIIMRRLLGRDGCSIWGQVTFDKEIEEYCKKIIVSLQNKGFISGAINIQLRIDPKDGPKCFEINGRLSSTEAIRARFGFNMVEASIVNELLKKEYTNFSCIPGTFSRYQEEVYNIG